MHRIATAFLIAGAVLALNGGMLREVFARDTSLHVPATIQLEPAASSRLMSLLLVLRHRQNIVNLMQGKEGRIGAKKS